MTTGISTLILFAIRHASNSASHRSVAVKTIPYIAVVPVFLWLGCANADEFSDRCAQLARQAKISVEFQDRAVAADDTRNVQALNGLSGKPADSLHNVYGLTHANPVFQLGVTPHFIAGDQGQVCAMPDLSLRLGFSEFVVYLATELIDECRRDIIRAHEQEHVNTWKSQMRASAQLLTTILRRDIGEPRIYASREEAEAGVRAWSNDLVTPWAKRIVTTVIEAQKAIDTPTSYSIVTSRLRTCSQAVRGGSR